MKKKTERQINESYDHMKPYLSDTDDCGTELREMCEYCERYCGDNHEYEDCLNMACFRFYLAYEYLEWINSSDGY